MSKKLTPWFPPGVKPVRVGEYNASQSKMVQGLRIWDGENWSEMYFSCESNAEIAKCKNRICYSERIYWRGLAQDPAIKPKKASKK